MTNNGSTKPALSSKPTKCPSCGSNEIYCNFRDKTNKIEYWRCKDCGNFWQHYYGN